MRAVLLAKTSDSFSVQSDWVWVDPGDCAPSIIPPSFDCKARQVAMYQLIQACPATLNGLSCG